MAGELHAFKAPVRPGLVLCGPGDAHSVFWKAQEGVEEGFEVGLTEEAGPVSGIVKESCHCGRIGGKWNAVHPDPVVSDVLAGKHRGPGGHADHVLRVRPLVADSIGRQCVGYRGPRHRATVASEGVVALLVCGHEQDLASHQDSSPGTAWKPRE